MQSTPTSKHSQDPGAVAPRPPVQPITAGRLRTMLAPPGSPDELTAPRLGLSSERLRPCRCPVLVPSSALTSEEDARVQRRPRPAWHLTAPPTRSAPAARHPTEHGACRARNPLDTSPHAAELSVPFTAL